MARYKSLISLTTIHSYYESGICTELSTNPLSDSVILLRKQRGFIKKMPAGFQVVLEVQPDDKSVISFNENLQLFFALQPHDAAEFFGISNLDQTIAPARSFSNGCKMYFRNNGDTLEYRVLDDIIRSVHNLRFSMEFSPSAVSLVIKDDQDNVVDAEYDIDGNPISGPYSLTANPDDGSFFKKLDLSKLSPGLFTATVTNDADATDKIEFKLYRHDALCETPCAGFLELNISAFADPVSTIYHTMEIPRRSTDWQYLVVNRSGLALDEIDLVVTDESSDDGTEVYDTYHFDGNPVGADPEDQPDQTIIGGFTTLIFTSQESIPFYQKSKTGIELKIINEGDDVDDPGTVIIEHLPNPDPRFSSGPTSTIYVYV